MVSEKSSGSERNYTYDRRDNLTKIVENGKQTKAYEFGSINRLTKAWDGEGESANYQYNGLGHRVGKQVNNAEKIEYILDLTKNYYNLLQKEENGEIQSYVWDSNLVSAETTKSKVFYLQDSLGSPLRLMERNTDIVESYGYDEFGNDLYGNQGEEQPFGYTGYQYDKIGGTYFAQAREYNSKVGRFISEDFNKGTTTFKDSMNYYLYCINSPLQYIDLNGEYTAKEGVLAHEVLQACFMSLYGPMGEKEFPVHGYAYSKSGKGRVDIMLYTDIKEKKVEVYELKPITQHKSNAPDYNDPETIEDGRASYNFIPGKVQRQGYIDALKGMGFTVNDKGNTFNPNYLTLPLPFNDKKNIRYYTYPDEPGMIYWAHVNKPELEPEPEKVPQKDTVKEKKDSKDWAIGGAILTGGALVIWLLYQAASLYGTGAPGSVPCPVG